MISAVLLLSFLMNLYLGIYVVSKGRGNRTHSYYFVFVFFVSMWILSQVILANLQNPNAAGWVGRLAFFMVTMGASSFFSFTLVFPKECKTRNCNVLVASSFIIGTVVSFLFLFSDVFQKRVYETLWGIRPEFGPGFKYYTIWLILSMVSSLIILLKKYSVSEDTIEKAQIKLVFCGMALFFLLSFSTAIILPLMGFRKYSSISSSFTIIIIGTIAYAILKYRFIDLKIAIKKGFVNSILAWILISLLLSIYTLMYDVPFLRKLFPPIATIALIAFLIAFGFNRLSKAVHYLVEQTIFKGKYDYPKIVSNFSKSISNILEMEKLNDSVSETLREIFEASKCKILIMFTGNPLDLSSVSKISSDDSKLLNMQDIVCVISQLANANDIIRKEEINMLVPEQQSSELKDLFDLLECEVISVLHSENTTVGIIALGPKRDGSAYSMEEINLLRSLSSQAVIAFTRASHYQKNIYLKAQYEKMLEQMSNGVIVTDTSNNLVYINQRAIEMLGVKERAKKENVNFHYLPDQIKGIIREKNSGRADLTDCEIKIDLKGEGPLPLSISFASLQDQENEIHGLIAVLTDLTEIKKWEEKVRQTDKLASLGTLAAGMAHEIKNPLSFVKTFMQMLPEKVQDSQFLLSNVAIAENQVNSIDFIIEQLLNYALPSVPFFHEIVVQEVIEDCLVLLKKTFQNENIYVHREFPGKPVKLNADGKQLKQVFLNLFLNAIQAMAGSAKRELRINLMETRASENYHGLNSMTDSKDEVIIRVSDSGNGILPQWFPRIFDPFFTTKDKGSGLGLSVVYSIVKEHGGRIDVETEPSKGTIFVLTFPREGISLTQPLEIGNTAKFFQSEGD